MKVKITFEELGDAYMAYRRVSRSPKNKNTVIQFCRFLGDNVDEEIWNEIYKTNEVDSAVAEKIRWITGPNARTIYKAWCAKHGTSK